jgi:hypothetical protein
MPESPAATPVSAPESIATVHKIPDQALLDDSSHQQKPTEAKSTLPSVKPVIAAPADSPLSFEDEWGSDDFDMPKTDTVIPKKTVIDQSKSISTSKPSVAPIAVTEQSAKEKSADLPSSAGWDEDWGNDEEDDFSSSVAPSVPQTMATSMPDAPKSVASPEATLFETTAPKLPATAPKPIDLDWGSDEADKEVHVAEPKADPKASLSELTPPSSKNSNAPLPPSSVLSAPPAASGPQVSHVPAKRTVASFVTPSLVVAEPPKPKHTAGPPVGPSSQFKPPQENPTDPTTLHRPVVTAAPPKTRVAVPTPKVAFTPSLPTTATVDAVKVGTMPINPDLTATAPTVPIATPAMALSPSGPSIAATAPTNAVPAPRSVRPKAAPPKQTVIAAPFAAPEAATGGASAHTRTRSVQRGPMTLQDMKRPCAVATFGFGGVLALSFARLPSSFSNQPPQAGPVSLLPISKLLSTMPEYLAMKAFPGPALSKSTKELLAFATSRCKHVDQTPVHSHPVRSEAGRLLWHFLRVLLESKGVIGGPKGCEKSIYALLNQTGNESAFGPIPPPVGDCAEAPLSPEKRKEVVFKIQEMVVAGKREEALHYAISEKVWDHALVIAAWISPSVHRDTVSAYVVSNLSIGSPLRMTYLQLCGKTSDLFKQSPSAATASNALVFAPGLVGNVVPSLSSHASTNPYNGIVDHWKVNIAAALANKPVTPASVAPATATQQPSHQQQQWYDQALVQLGDALWSHGTSVEAAHLCYILADYRLDCQLDPGSRFVLIGGDHKRHPRTVVSNIEALHKTELFEFAKRQGAGSGCLPGFQPYKLCFALALVDFGLVKPALEYLDSIKLLVSESKNPSTIYSQVFLSQLKEIHARVKSLVDGKPLSVQLESGTSQSSSGWFGFGNLLKAAVDKVMGDEEEERAQMKLSAPGVPSGTSTPLTSSANGPTAPLAISGTMMVPNMLPQMPLAPIGPPSISGSVAVSGIVGGPKMPPQIPMIPVGQPPLSSAKQQPTPFPLPVVGGGAKTSIPVTQPPIATPKQVAPPPTAGPASASHNGLPPIGALPSIPLPTVRSTPKFNALGPKAAKLTAAAPKTSVAAQSEPPVPSVPAVAGPPAQALVKEDEPESSVGPKAEMDDDEAELFGGWDFEAPKVAKTDPETSQKPVDDKEHTDDSLSAIEKGATPSTKPSPEQPVEPPLQIQSPQDVKSAQEPTMDVPVDTPLPEASPVTPAPRTNPTLPPKGAARKTPNGFKPSGPGAALLSNGSTGTKTPQSSAMEELQVTAKPQDELVTEPSPPLSTSTSASSLDIREATSAVQPPVAPTAATTDADPSPPKSNKPPKSLPPSTNLEQQTKAEVQTPAAAAVSESAAEDSKPIATPKRPSLLPPKKTPASKPAAASKSDGRPKLDGQYAKTVVTGGLAGLEAPEGLPPLAALDKQPFKPAQVSTGLPPSSSSSQQKRTERMAKKSISASILPRPDMATSPSASENNDDDGAHSDDERAHEKVLEDAKAEIARQDATADSVASIVPPVSSLPPIAASNQHPPHAHTAPPTGTAKPREKGARKPMPRPHAPVAVPGGFAPMPLPSQPLSTQMRPAVEETASQPLETPSKPAMSTAQEGKPGKSKPQKVGDESDGESSMKTPVAKAKGDSKKDAAKTEPKRSRFSWLNPRNWFPKTPQQDAQPKPKEVSLGNSLKDGPFYRHPELGWVERGKEEEKRKAMAEAAAPPEKGKKRRNQSSGTDDISSASGLSTDSLVTPQPSRGSFSRNGSNGSAAGQEEPSTPSTLKAGPPGSSRSARGRRYVGSSGDVIDTMRNSGSNASILAVPPMTPTPSGISVFTPLPSADSAAAPTASEPLEPVATVRQPKAKKSNKDSKAKQKDKKADENGASSDDDLINSQPLTLSASIALLDASDDEQTTAEAPRKSRAERKAESEAQALAAQNASPHASAKTFVPPPFASTGSRPKFASPMNGFKPSSSSSKLVSKSPTATTTPSTQTSEPEIPSSTDTPASIPEPQQVPESTTPEFVAPEPEPEPELKTPLPMIGLPSLGLPPPGAARPKSGIRAARPKSAASRLQPLTPPASAQE